MTALAILLGVAFVSSSLVFSTTLTEAYKRSAQHGLDDIDIDVRLRRVDTGALDDASRSGVLLDQSLLDRTAAVPGVASTTGVVSGFTVLTGPDGAPLGRGWATIGANYDAARYPIVQGRAPRTAGEIAVDARTAQRAGWRIGQTVRLSIDGPRLDQTVVGVFATATATSPPAGRSPSSIPPRRRTCSHGPATTPRSS